MVTTSSVCTVVGEMKGHIAALIAGFEAIIAADGEILEVEAEVLNGVLNQIKPVVKYLDGKVVVRSEWMEDYSLHLEHLEERGVKIIDNDEKGFVVGRSGKLYQLDWYNYKEGLDKNSIAEVLETSARGILEHFSLIEILAGLASVFEEAIAKLDERKTSLQQRLRIIKAVTEKGTLNAI